MSGGASGQSHPTAEQLAKECGDNFWDFLAERGVTLPEAIATECGKAFGRFLDENADRIIQAIADRSRPPH